jgi:6-pyruvoyltetrahydropterin/6-carboxytetrahydropterin synthase
MAREIFRAVRERLTALQPDSTYPIAPGVRLERVRVTETATSWAEYSE